MASSLAVYEVLSDLQNTAEQAMKNNKITFDAIIDGEERKLAVIRPNQEIKLEGEDVYTTAFRRARDAGAYMRLSLGRIAREEQVWTEQNSEREAALARILQEGEKTLAKGGIHLKEAREIAINMRYAREELRELRMKLNELDQITAESKAETVRFDFYVSCCTVDNKTGERIFISYDDFMEKQHLPYAQQAQWKMSMLLHNVSENFAMSLPENKFLLNYKFSNEQGQLINKDGELVDVLGRRVSPEGHLINDAGQPIDEEGNILKDTGEYDVEFQPFITDEEPTVVEGECEASEYAEPVAEDDEQATA